MFKKRLRRLEILVKQAEAPEKPAPRPLQSAQDVMDLLQEQVEALRAARWCGALPKARALGYLAAIARKTIETGILAQHRESQQLGAGSSNPPFKVYMGFDPNLALQAAPSNVPSMDPGAMAGFMADMETQAELRQRAGLPVHEPKN